MVNPYIEYYNNQAGGALPAFKGTRFQRGYGFFSRIFNFLMPLVKKTLPVLGKQAVNTGLALSHDLLEGKDLKTASKQRLKEAGGSLLDKVEIGLKQKGFGKRKIRKRKMPFLKNVSTLENVVNSRSKKRRRYRRKTTSKKRKSYLKKTSTKKRKSRKRKSRKTVTDFLS